VGVRSVYLVLVAAGAASAILFACGQDLFFESSDGGTDASVDLGTAFDEAGRVCVCLPDVPEGWNGPVVFDEVADCASPWVEEIRVHRELDAGAHECSCNCEPGPTQCNWKQDLTVDCNSGSCPGTAAIPVGCVSKGGSCNGFYRMTITGGACQQDAGSRIEPSGFAKTARRCGTKDAVTRGVCGSPNQLCAPAHPPSAGHCIYRDGASACPAEYPIAQTYHARIEDTRACTKCSCDVGSAPCVVGLYNASSCDGPSRIGTVAANLCYPFSGATHYKLLQEKPSCVADGGAKSGQATPAGTITTCCRL
jgi:hypothetical protein